MTVSTQEDALNILGLGQSATKFEIKARYLEMAKKYHPDSNVTAPEDIREFCATTFAEASAAYACLTENPPQVPRPDETRRDVRSELRLHKPPQEKDVYGRVYGRIPPLSLGPKAFRFEISDPVNLVAAVSVGPGILQLRWQESSGREFGMRCICAGAMHRRMFESNPFRFYMLQDLESNERRTALVRNDCTGDFWAPWPGLWSLFPFWSCWNGPKFMEMWEATFPGVLVPESEFFGPRYRSWNWELKQLLGDGLRYVVHWYLADLFGFDAKKADAVRRHTRQVCADALATHTKLTKREITKLGFELQADRVRNKDWELSF